MAKSKSYRIAKKIRLYLPDGDNRERKRLFNRLLERAGSVTVLDMVVRADLEREGRPAPDLERLEGLIDATVRQIMLKRRKPVKDEKHSDYHKMWRIVDGAVSDAFANHMDYLTPKGMQAARLSIVKRVTGAVLQGLGRKVQGAIRVKPGVCK